MQINPTSDNVVVRRDEAKDKTKGGIIIPDGAKDAPKRGTVVASGPGRWEHGIQIYNGVNIGDKVFFSAYAGAEVEADGEKLLILKASEILAVIYD